MKKSGVHPGQIPLWLASTRQNPIQPRRKRPDAPLQKRREYAEAGRY